MFDTKTRSPLRTTGETGTLRASFQLDNGSTRMISFNMMSSQRMVCGCLVTIAARPLAVLHSCFGMRRTVAACSATAHAARFFSFENTEGPDHDADELRYRRCKPDRP